MSHSGPVTVHSRSGSQKYAPLDVEMASSSSGVRKAEGGERKVENFSGSPASQEILVLPENPDIDFGAAHVRIRGGLREKSIKQGRRAKALTIALSTLFGASLIRATGAAGAVGASNTYIPPIEGMGCPAVWDCDVNITREPYNYTLGGNAFDTYDLNPDGSVFYRVDTSKFKCPGEDAGGTWNRIVSLSKVFQGENSTLIIPCTTASNGACPNGPSAELCVDAGNMIYGTAIGGGTALTAFIVSCAAPRLPDGQPYLGYMSVFSVMFLCIGLNLLIDGCDHAIKSEYSEGLFRDSTTSIMLGLLVTAIGSSFAGCTILQKGVSNIPEDTVRQLAQEELMSALQRHLPESLSSLALSYVGPQEAGNAIVIHP